MTRFSRWRELRDGRVWMGIYFMRTAILVALAVGSFVVEARLVTLMIVVVVIPYNLAAQRSHRVHDRAPAYLPIDQVLASLCALITPLAAFGAIMSAIAAAGTDTLGIAVRRVRWFSATASAVLLLGAVVHRDYGLAAFVVPEFICAIAVSNVVSYLKNKRSASTERLESLLDGLHAWVYEADVATGDITYCNQQILERVGAARHMTDLMTFIHPDDVDSVVRNYLRSQKSSSPTMMDVRLVLGDEVHYMEQRTTFATYKGRVRLRCVLFDVSSRKRVELEMEHRAFHDSLTELPNRALFLDRLDHGIVRARRMPMQHAVLMCDLDNFKDVNDGMGHHVGDALLAEVGARLGSVIGAANTLARLGGDEFAILLEGSTAAEAIEIGRALIEAVAAPYVNGGLTVFPSVSIGVAAYPAHGGTSGELLRHADVAMYHAKRLRLGVVAFDEELNPASAEKLAVLADFRQALVNNELEAYYQPVVDARTRMVTSCEALVRWNHPTLGLRPPASFVPVVCAGGLSSELARWMLGAVIEQLDLWERADIAIPVSVNMSAVDVADQSLVDWLLTELDRRAVSPKLLSIELTEAELLDRSSRTIDAWRRLFDADFTTAVDDFGTGYSSLVWLRDLPVGSLKIDRTFVDSMFADERSQTIVRSTIQMANALRLNIVGEGVEDDETAAALSQLGCHSLQGFLFSHPVQAAAMSTILRNGKPIATLPIDTVLTDTVLTDTLLADTVLTDTSLTAV
jgi:diguanylate cyclase (GGDEF)-like protein